MRLKELDGKIQSASIHFLQKILQIATTLAVSIFATHLLLHFFHFGVLGYIFCLLTFSGSIYLQIRRWGVATLAIFNLIYILILIVFHNFSGDI